jgi:hypothetical protein
MTLTIKSVYPKLDESGNLISVIFEVSSFHLSSQTNAQNKNVPDRIEIELTKAAIEYWLLPLHRKNRVFFPGYKEPFQVETDLGSVTCWVSGSAGKTQPGDANAGQYIVKNLGPWFKTHNFKDGDKVFIEVIEFGKKYRLLEK